MKLGRNRLSAYLALLANTAIWGLALPIVKKGFVNGLSPDTFLLGRYVLAVLTSLPIVLLIARRPSVKKTFKFQNFSKVILLEIIGTFLALWILYEGVARTTAIASSLISVTYPVFITIGAIYFLREREQKQELWGLMLAVLGTLALTLIPFLNGHLDGDQRGNLLVFVQNLVIAAYYLLAKKFYKGLDKWSVSHISFWVGLVGFSLLTLIQGTNPIWALVNLLHSGFWPIFAVVYMGTAGSVLAATLYLIGQDKIEASEAAIFVYLNPIFSIPASALLLGEHLTLLEGIAIAITTLGVYLAAKRS